MLNLRQRRDFYPPTPQGGLSRSLYLWEGPEVGGLLLPSSEVTAPRLPSWEGQGVG